MNTEEDRCPEFTRLAELAVKEFLDPQGDGKYGRAVVSHPFHCTNKICKGVLVLIHKAGFTEDTALEQFAENITRNNLK